jgi:predicted nucleic acid-binding protein
LGAVILIDSNILIDVIEQDPERGNWSLDQIADLSVEHRLAVNEIAVAEVAPNMGTLAAFYEEMDRLDIVLKSIDDKAAFCSGVAFRSYRARRDKPPPKSILPDFLIGGHAQTLGATILTRDPRFYRAYFPAVPLITPSKDEA